MGILLIESKSYEMRWSLVMAFLRRVFDFSVRKRILLIVTDFGEALFIKNGSLIIKNGGFNLLFLFIIFNFQFF
jgi:hypothetical protein